MQAPLEARAQGADSGTVLAPFVVQRGAALYFLASEAAGWVVAELRFDPKTCTYAEVRRMQYDWPREAFGALLSRVAVAGEVDPGAVDATSRDFGAWLSAQFRASDGDVVPSA
ncbi:MAG: hypothetical protein QM753_03935 [Thermomicrobiales bacterium]